MGSCPIGYTDPQEIPGLLVHTSVSGLLSPRQLTTRAAYVLLSTVVAKYQLCTSLNMASLGLSLAGVPHMPVDFLTNFSNELTFNKSEFAPEIFIAFARDLMSR